MLGRIWRALTKRTSNAALLIAFLATGVVAIFILVSASNEDRWNDEAAYKAATRQAERARVEAKARCGYLTGIDQEQCRNRIYDRARKESRQEEQLYVQRRSATWDVAMGKAAAISIIFSSVGVLMIFLTLDAQREANKISREEAEAAETRAEEALEHARNATALELRPYVFVERITSQMLFERNFQLVIWLKNFGRTPARNIETVVTTYVTRELSKLKPLRPRADHISIGTAAPDACRRAFTRLSFGARQWNAPPYDPCWGVVRISFTYTDDLKENAFKEAVDYYIRPSELLGDDPTFYLLTDARIEHDRKWRKKQGDLLAILRTRTDIVRESDSDEADEGETKEG